MLTHAEIEYIRDKIPGYIKEYSKMTKEALNDIQRKYMVKMDQKEYLSLDDRARLKATIMVFAHRHAAAMARVEVIVPPPITKSATMQSRI